MQKNLVYKPQFIQSGSSQMFYSLTKCKWGLCSRDLASEASAKKYEVPSLFFYFTDNRYFSIKKDEGEGVYLDMCYFAKSRKVLINSLLEGAGI